MSSLQEQLLKAGLVDEKQLARAKQKQNRQATLARKQGGKKQPAAKPARSGAQERKAQRDRELNQKRQAEARQKELAAQATQLIDVNRLDRAQGDLPYSFVYRRKVKKIFVTAAQKKQLADGQLAIATWVRPEGRKFELVPREIAAKIAERDASFVVDTGQPAEPPPEDDPYADYQVPDDLVW